MFVDSRENVGYASSEFNNEVVRLPGFGKWLLEPRSWLGDAHMKDVGKFESSPAGTAASDVYGRDA